MLLSAAPLLFATNFKSNLTAPGLWLATILTAAGCADSPPEPPVSPSIPVENVRPHDQEIIKVAPTDPNSAPVPVPKPVDEVVPSEAEIDFESLSANEKLDRIAAVIRSAWGDGQGFQYVPDTAVTESSEDPLVLTLRWQAVEKKIAPLLQRAFGIEGTLVCRFTSPGEVECNHPVYQLAIQRAQNRPDEFADLHNRVDATLSNTAPVLREQFLQQAERQTAFYESIRLSLMSSALPGQYELSQDIKDSFADDQQCAFFTKWTSLPVEFEKSTDAGSFQWRLKLVIREAVDSIESEWDNLRTEKNRLELVSFAQYRRGQDEPFEPVGPLGITAMGFDNDTTIIRWGKRYNSRRVPGTSVLESLEEHPSTGVYPNPATVVGISDPMRTVVTSVQQAIQQHLTQDETE